MAVAQIHKDRLEELKRLTEESNSYWQPNVEIFNDSKKFIFDTSITNPETLSKIGRPPLECNTIEAFISRLRGEFARHEPSISVRAADGYDVDPETIKTVENFMRAILLDADKNLFSYNIYSDQIGGGYSIMKIRTDYQDSKSFNQILKLEKPYDITKCGFDCMARENHKGDARFCYEFFPKYIDELKNKYKDVNWDNIDKYGVDEEFNWFYLNKDRKVALICDFYEKQFRDKKLYLLANNQIMYDDEYEKFIKEWEDRVARSEEIQQPPAIVESRKTQVCVICRYRFSGNEMLEYTETDFEDLPYIFVDGNSVDIKDTPKSKSKQKVRSYAHHAFDLQKLRNCAMQTIGAKMEGMVMSTWLIANESMDANNLDSVLENQVPRTVTYNCTSKEKPEMMLPPPQLIQAQPMPPEIMEVFMMTDKVMQMILGPANPNIAGQNDLSGKAVIELASQNNAAAMPEVVNYLGSLSQAANVIVNIIPKYYKTKRTIPVVNREGKKDFITINDQENPNSPMLKYPSNALQVTVEAGVNFSVQKSQALQQIIGLAQAMPIFAQFMNTVGLPILLDNLDIRGADILKDLAKAFQEHMQQMQQQQMQMQQQNNPIAIKQQELQIKQQQNQAENALELAKIQNDNLQIQLGAANAHQDRIVEVAKINAENLHNTAKFGLENHDQLHQHAKDAIELTHNIMQDHVNNNMQQQQMNNQSQMQTPSQ